MQHLNDIEYAKEKQNGKDEATAELRAWAGFATIAPYPIAFVDDLRKSRVVLEERKSSVESMIRIYSRAIEEGRDQLTRSQQSERQFDESGENAGRFEAGKNSKAGAAISSRIAAERVSRLMARQGGQRAELAGIEARLELVSTQIKLAEGQVVFSREEFDLIQKRIATERTEAIKDLNAALGRITGDHEIEGWRVTFLDLENDFWKQRFEALNSKDPEVGKKARKKFNEQLAIVEEWSAVGNVLVAGAGREDALDTLRTALEDARGKLANQKLLLKFAIAELNGNDPRPLNIGDRIVDVASSIWDTELYLAEQDVFIDGRKVTSYRAVTLGKILRFIIILIVGYFLLRFLSGRLRNLLQKRARTPEAAIDLASRAFFGTGLFLILIYGLNTARIPFTAFAFLGGALAIGVGFGTQTLLKNLISGIILAFERPFKVGDIVEAGGVTGRIRSIGIRASIVQHFDGIETLIPNSCLLEDQVTNWSFTDSLIRRTITVGVAYGSQTREVANRLLEVAAEHGLVLDTPKPEVRFHDFGDNALGFQLLIWFDGNTIAGDTLASDLRFMIDRSFAEAGLVIAFPQRDIHFDVDRPLRVEWSERPPSGFSSTG